MKNARLALLALLLIPGALPAQTTTTNETASTVRSSSGDFALLFDLGGLANLALTGFSAAGDTSMVGAGFGAKYFLADDIALRLGLTLESNTAIAPADSASDSEFSAFRFAIAPSVVVNVVKSGPVAGYVGGQVSYAMTSSTSDPADESQPDVESTGSTIGAAAIIGAEWFAWSHVSLSAEYQLGYARSTAEEERTLPGGDPERFERPTQSALGLHSRGVLTAAIYW